MQDEGAGVGQDVVDPALGKDPATARYGRMLVVRCEIYSAGSISSNPSRVTKSLRFASETARTASTWDWGVVDDAPEGLLPTLDDDACPNQGPEEETE